MNINIYTFNNKNKGFTLIEVMVAALILFSVIATVAIIYSGAFTSSEKANNHAAIAGVLPAILKDIREDIRSQGNLNTTTLTNKGKSWNITYQWQAQLLQFKSAPEKFDVDSGKFITPPKKYKLWDVTLTLTFNNFTKKYNFKEVSWTNA